MKVTWLGQAGLLFDTGVQRVMIDPYLSNSVAAVQPKNYRRLPIDEGFFDTVPQVMLFTHDHLDHYDPETVPRFLGADKPPMTVLCPTSVWQKVRKLGGGHNYVEFNRGTEWTEGALRFRAIRAVHSDPFAIGVLITDLITDTAYYVTGDTLYHREIFSELGLCPDCVFLPVNGVGNNMNPQDAERFAEACGARITVPIHFGMFDEIKKEDIKIKNCRFLTPYEETEF